MDKELWITRFALLKAVQQLNHVYSEECCKYGDVTNTWTNRETMQDYLNRGWAEYLTKGIINLAGEMDEIGGLYGYEKPE